jgi:hypothetical protein
MMTSLPRYPAFIIEHGRDPSLFGAPPQGDT